LARRALLLATAALLLAAPSARADGDPASDFLLTRATFVPPEFGVNADTRALDETVRLARMRGYAVRVALIGSTYDLGSVASLMNRPKLYARFLGQELRFVYAGPLLVVMPSGYGFARGGTPVPADQAVVDRLAPPGQQTVGLVQGATSAVRALARAHGVAVPANAAAAVPTPGGGGAPWALIAGISAALLILIAGFVVISRRKGHPS
jgi:hypothetical protein